MSLWCLEFLFMKRKTACYREEENIILYLQNILLICYYDEDEHDLESE